MKRTFLRTLTGIVAMVLLQGLSAAQVILQTGNLRLEIATDGTVKSLTAKPSGTEYVWTSDPGPVAVVYRGGQLAVASQEEFAEDEAPAYRGGEAFPASHASLAGDKLTVGFAKANVTATYRVTTGRDYLALRLESLVGDPIDRIDLVRLRLRSLPYLGPWIDVAYDDRFGICLCAGNIKTNAGMNRRPQYVQMQAIATRDVTLESATAVLFGCHDPRNKFLDAMEVVERDFGMPSGARHRRSPIQQYSYLWCSPTPADVDQYIALARRAGFRMILFSYTSFTRGAGHFLWNSRFPNGAADLRKVTDKIRAAGLKVGLHIHYSKAVKTDPYVTPVPDDRLHAVRAFTLAAAVDEKAGTIPVQENPAGCTRDDGRRILKAGKELIAYRDYTTTPPYQFVGCERGHLKTAAAGHRAGQRVGLLDVDDWNIFIRFDQNTDIQDEAARRIAEIFRQTGPYDMVYFDGAEDVHDPFWHHVAAAQHRVFRLLQPEPPVCEAAMSSHFSWHMLSRGNAYDVPAGHVKSFCHEVSCRTAPVRAVDFTRINFGWIFALYDNLGPDDLEYVLSRGAAWDCPFSIQMTPQQVAANPRAEDCLDVIKTWEDARIENRLTEAQRGMLKTLDPKHHQLVKTWHAVLTKRWVETWSKGLTDQEHHLFINEKAEYELVPIEEIPGVAGGLVRAYAFRRAAQPGDTYVLLWAVKGEGDLRLPVAPERLTVMRPFGTRVPVKAEGQSTIIPVGGRRYVVLTGMDRDQARQVVRTAKWSARNP